MKACERFATAGLPGFRRVSNLRCYAGHVRLLGVIVHTWNNEIGGQRGSNEWAEHRVWSIGLIALHHVTPGKRSTNRPGWSITFARLIVKRIYGGFSVTWRWADMHRTRHP